MLRIQLSVDQATNGFVVYEGDKTTVHTDADSVVADLQKRCRDSVVNWVADLILLEQKRKPSLSK